MQVMATNGHAVTLPAPLSDVNAAIALGCLSYLIILSGGIAGDGVKGVGKTLKEFSLPISMSFRLFGALLSGLLVTELVYYYVNRASCCRCWWACCSRSCTRSSRATCSRCSPRCSTERSPSRLRPARRKQKSRLNRRRCFKSKIGGNFP